MTRFDNAIGHASAATVAFAARHARWVVALCLSLTVGSIFMVVNHLGLNTDTRAMLSEDLPFRRLAAQFEAAFPVLEQPMIIVVDADTSAQARDAAGQLADLLLLIGANLLLLDEPTNDLDVDTLRALEEALLGFGGCALVISHDRWFLDRIATHILAFEGDSQVVWFEGNYQDYEADRRRRLGTAADQPHRIKYKRLTH